MEVKGGVEKASLRMNVRCECDEIIEGYLLVNLAGRSSVQYGRSHESLSRSILFPYNEDPLHPKKYSASGNFNTPEQIRGPRARRSW
jgi:hypothetical protein